MQYVCMRHSSPGARIKRLRSAKVNQLVRLRGQGCNGTGARHTETHERHSRGTAEPPVRSSTVVELPSNPTAPTAGIRNGVTTKLPHNSRDGGTTYVKLVGATTDVYWRSSKPELQRSVVHPSLHSAALLLGDGHSCTAQDNNVSRVVGSPNYWQSVYHTVCGWLSEQQAVCPRTHPRTAVGTPTLESRVLLVHQTNNSRLSRSIRWRQRRPPNYWQSVYHTVCGWLSEQQAVWPRTHPRTALGTLNSDNLLCTSANFLQVQNCFEVFVLKCKLSSVERASEHDRSNRSKRVSHEDALDESGSFV